MSGLENDAGYGMRDTRIAQREDAKSPVVWR